MKFFGRKTKSAELSRREIIARRRQAVSDIESGASTEGFRRNRNISRTQERKADSDRQAWHDLRVKRRKLSAWLIGIVLSVIILLILLMQLIATIVAQAPSPIANTDSNVYTGVLEDYLRERPIERLRFLVRQDSLEEFFSTRAPEVATVKVVGTPQLATASLQLTFRQPVAQWASDTTTYFVDGSGVTFERNHFDPPAIAVKDNSNIDIEAGQEVLDRRFLSFLGHVVSGFTDNSMKVQEILLPDGMLRQVDVRLEGKPYFVRMTIDRDAAAQVGEAMHAIGYMDGRGMSPEYIDVRVDQRVFYK